MPDLTLYKSLYHVKKLLSAVYLGRVGRDENSFHFVLLNKILNFICSVKSSIVSYDGNFWWMVVAVILQLIKQTLQKSDIFHLIEGAFGPHYTLHSKLAMSNNKDHFKTGGFYEQSSRSPLSGPAVCICCVSIYQELVHINKISSYCQ